MFLIFTSTKMTNLQNERWNNHCEVRSVLVWAVTEFSLLSCKVLSHHKHTTSDHDSQTRQMWRNNSKVSFYPLFPQTHWTSEHSTNTIYMEYSKVMAGKHHRSHRPHVIWFTNWPVETRVENFPVELHYTSGTTTAVYPWKMRYCNPFKCTVLHKFSVELFFSCLFFSFLVWI